MITTIEELKRTHPNYAECLKVWQRCIAAYGGTDDLINYGAIKQHTRESPDNFARRKDEAYSFSFSRSIVDLYCQYLLQKDAERTLPESLTNDEMYQMFMDDCDLEGTDLDTFFSDSERYASIFGYIGVMVDRPQGKFQSKKEELDNKIYAYLSVYLPKYILDWTYARNSITGRPELIMLKLEEADGNYKVWYPDRWELYQVSEDKEGKDQVVLIGEGVNTLGEIPFVWFLNIKGLYKNIGISDIGDISRIDISIMRNLSHGEEVIEWGAFPMMVKPYQRVGAEVVDTVGANAVLEFDPDKPDSKPSWLVSAVAEPLTAIMSWLELKIKQIYRLAHVSKVAGETSQQAQSGVALKYQFQELNSKLSQKSDNLVEAELKILYYWMKWQGKEQDYLDVKIERSKDFSLDDLTEDLNNMITLQAQSISDTLQKYIQKAMYRKVFPGMPPEIQEEIDDEIDTYEPAETHTDESTTDYGNMTQEEMIAAMKQEGWTDEEIQARITEMNSQQQGE